MAQPVITNPQAVAAVLTGLGGTVIPGRTMMCDVPLDEVREFVPKVNDVLGLGCRRVSERVGEHPTKLGCNRGIVTIELFKRGE